MCLLQAGLKKMESTGNGYQFAYSALDLSNSGLVDISLVEYYSQLQHIDISGNYIQSNSMQLQYLIFNL